MTSPQTLAELTFSPDELAAFERDGFIIVRKLASEDLLRRMRDVTLDGLHRRVEPLELEADVHYPGAPQDRESRGGATIRRLKQAHSRDYVFTEWLTSPGLLGRLRQLLGPEVVCPLAHHNCVMTKEPQYSSDTGWHQDIRYWSFHRPDLVNAWLALGHEKPENGCLKVIPGSHRIAYSPEQFDQAIFLRDDLPQNQPLIQSQRFAVLEPGDVLFFHCLTFHAASRNHTTESKHSVVFTFRGADNLATPGSRSAQSPELLLH
ncbi:Phytanoyl-CoA dioxygenase (PhyH) [Caulifigura coniformis]|uniref:Phytanoyl-CoA dioxygenase (PhyH) n=1 Tax=Caulifigura coniformis TaxID=2527983 RepID=A0A517SEH9_9PLAN|nr:phytanoyl-CoA dioxygenase family protein [Caulifigura coniformis]QDT54507.1 Phytanoyl-CoA dioxygenase (PhyH) [Caulifigura coniformis]